MMNPKFSFWVVTTILLFHPVTGRSTDAPDGKKFNGDQFLDEVRSCEMVQTSFSYGMGYMAPLMSQFTEGGPGVSASACFAARAFPDKLGVTDPADNFSDPKDYLLQDQLICNNCLPASIRERWKKDDKSKSIDEELQLKANVEKIGDKLQAKINGMALQAALLTEDYETGMPFVTQNLEQVKADPAVLNSAIKKLSDYPGPEKNLREILTPKFNEHILKKDDESCFSYKAFLSYRMKTPKHKFAKALKETEVFKQEDWDYVKLKEKYNEAVRLAGNGDPVAKEQQDEITQRLEFLYRNPMLKNLFSAHYSPELNKGKVQAKQKELFSLLKDHLGTPAYQKKVKDFFSGDKDNHNALVFARTRANQELSEEYKRVLESPESLKSEALPTDVFALNEYLLKATGKSTSNCWAEGSTQNCIDVFVDYCPLVNKAMDDKSPKISYADALENRLLKASTYLPEEDDDYKAAKNLFCKDFWKDADGNLVNFPQYQKANCHSQNEHDCLVSFLEKHTEPTNVFNKSASRLKRMSSALQEHLKEHKEWNAPDKIAEGAGDYYIAPNELGDFIKKHGNTPYSRYGRLWGDDGKYKHSSGNIANTEVKKELGERSLLSRTLSSVMDPLTGSGEQTALREDMVLAPNGYVGTNFTLPENTTVGDVKKKKELNEKQMDELENDMIQTQAKISKVENFQEKTLLEEKMQALQTLLNQKEQTAKEYERLLEQYSTRLADATAANKKNPVKEVDQGPAQVTSTIRPHTPSVSSEVYEGGVGRSIASAPEAFHAANTYSQGGATLGGGMDGKNRSGGARLNDVMKAKYGITIQGNSEGTVVVASEQGLDRIPSSIVKGADEVSVPAIRVPRDEFERLKGNDVETLKDIYDDKIKGLNSSIVKITIVPEVAVNGDVRELEFYAIKEGGQVVFQPVRRNRLQDLNNTLPTL